MLIDSRGDSLIALRLFDCSAVSTQILHNPVLAFFFSGRSLAQVSLLFGHVVRGWSAGNRVFEVTSTDCSDCVHKYV